MFDAKGLLDKMMDGSAKAGWDQGGKGGGWGGGYEKGGYSGKGGYEKGGYEKSGYAEKPMAKPGAEKWGQDDEAIRQKKMADAGMGAGAGLGGAPGAGGLGGLLGGGVGSGGGGILGRAGDVLRQIFGGNPAAAGLAGGLAGSVLGRGAGTGIGGSVMRLGGLAAVGGLAYLAWQRWQASRNGQPAPAAPAQLQAPPANSGFAPADQAGQQRLGMLVLKSMISAAKADGQVDPEEMQKIVGEMGAQQLSDAEKAFLMGELAKPVDADALAREATTPQEATAAYAASVMVIGTQSAQEQTYLQQLAQKLRLDPQLVTQVHQQVASPPPAPAPAA